MYPEDEEGGAAIPRGLRSIERDDHRRPLSKFPEDFSERTAEASDRDHVLV
jgi:hypothetical protein